MMHKLAILGQIMFGAFWLYNGINHFIYLKMLTGYAASKKVPQPKLAVVVGGILLIIGGVGILVGAYTHLAILCLVLFLIPTTLMMHNFWASTDSTMKSSDQVSFLKNMALLGTLLILWNMTFPYSLF